MVNTYQHISLHNHIFQLHLCRQSLSSYKHQMRPQAANQPGQPEVLALLYLGDTLCPLIFFLLSPKTGSVSISPFPSCHFRAFCVPKSRDHLVTHSLSSVSQGRTVTVWFSETAGICVTGLLRIQQQLTTRITGSFLHSFLGAPCDGNPGGAAPGGKPIRPDCPIRPA